MKRILICLVLLAGLLIGTPAATSAETLTIPCGLNGGEYYVSMPAGLLSGSNPNTRCSGELFIDSRVKVIGGLAFEKSTVTSVILPKSVLQIAPYAFADTVINSISIPDSVTTIGPGAFAFTKLASIKLPKYLDRIEESLFYGTPLTSITIPKQVKSIGDNAFRGTLLGKVSIPDTVSSIGDYAFEDSQLTEVIIPDSIVEIQEGTFANTPLTSIKIGKSVQRIGSSAFLFTKISSLVIPDSVTTIGRGAFGGSSISTITIPNSVKEIGDAAFAGTKLTSVVIPNSLTRISASLFLDTQLNSVIIPNSITNIGKYAFFNTPLTSINIPDSVTVIGDYAFSYTSLQSLNIPDSVTTIGEAAFARIDELVSVSIPDGLQNLGQKVFEDNYALKTILYCGEFVDFPVSPTCTPERRAAVELKAKEESEAKAKADLKAKTEADAKAQIDKAVSEIAAKTEADAKAAIDKAVAETEAKLKADLKAEKDSKLESDTSDCPENWIIPTPNLSIRWDSASNSFKSNFGQIFGNSEPEILSFNTNDFNNAKLSKISEFFGTEFLERLRAEGGNVGLRDILAVEPTINYLSALITNTEVDSFPIRWDYKKNFSELTPSSLLSSGILLEDIEGKEIQYILEITKRGCANKRVVMSTAVTFPKSGVVQKPIGLDNWVADTEAYLRSRYEVAEKRTVNWLVFDSNVKKFRELLDQLESKAKTTNPPFDVPVEMSPVVYVGEDDLQFVPFLMGIPSKTCFWGSPLYPFYFYLDSSVRLRSTPCKIVAFAPDYRNLTIDSKNSWASLVLVEVLDIPVRKTLTKTEAISIFQPIIKDIIATKNFSEPLSVDRINEEFLSIVLKRGIRDFLEEGGKLISDEVKRIETEKAAAEKAAADKVAAELKAKQEADAKVAAEKFAADKAAGEKIIADANAEAARILAAAKAAAAKKKITITCVKGKLSKKVTAVKPLCPKGYKKK
jgi:hypothetical protein